MNRDMERHKEFSRRAFMLGAGKFTLFLTLTSRLAYLQIVEQSKFQTLSDQNRISMRLIIPQRGEIMDRFGVPLAVNKPDFSAFLIPEIAGKGKIEGILSEMSKIIIMNEDEKERVRKDIKENRAFTPILVKENLSWEDMAKIEMRLPELSGITVEEGQMRTYPLGQATAHIIGYTGLVSKSEVSEDPITKIPGFRVGKNGIEKRFEKYLRGKAGKVQTEVNSVGRQIRELERQDGIRGSRLTLTLDSDLQMQCQEYLSAHDSASAVVMDALTGEIYALCSHPSFDPNLFAQGIPATVWEELLSDPKNPLTNKVIAGQYPPGSTFKMVTALAGLEAGAITEHTRVNCPGYYYLGGTNKFHCWREHGHGSVNVVDALRESCDCFFYETGRRVGINKIAEVSRRLGLGERLGFEIPGEAQGLIPDREWKKKRYNEVWQMGESLISAIGQGYMLTTPLQLAVMTARLVNGGYAVKPSVVRSIGKRNRILDGWDKLDFDPYHLSLVRKGMEEVVNSPRGTAFSTANTRDKNFLIGGKTGTAQVKRISKRDRDMHVRNQDLPWKFRHHGLFVCYGPIEDPKYVTAVVVEHGVGGSISAAPIARQIMQAVHKRDPRVIRAVNAEIENKL